MKKLNLLIAILCAIIAFSSCATDDELTMTRTELLTNNTWKITARVINEVDESIDDCEDDDRRTFSTDGTWNYDIGAITCFVDEESGSGEWSFSNDESQINYNSTSGGVGLNFVMTVIELTSNEFTYQIDFETGGASTMRESWIKE